jgi:hypothetical protein
VTDFILAGCHGGEPLDDLPVFPGRRRWFVDRWTAPMPPSEAFAAAIGVPVHDWPLAFEEQLALAAAGACCVLVRGDPLVATPHLSLVQRLKADGLKVLVRRRVGVGDLLGDLVRDRPIVRTTSAPLSAPSQRPVLVVSDEEEPAWAAIREAALAIGWRARWVSDAGRETMAVGEGAVVPQRALLSLLLTAQGSG